MDLKGKKMTVIGLGTSGLASALLLKDLGCDVWVSDSSSSKDLEDRAAYLKEKGIKVELGGHSRRPLKDSDMLVVSPGVSDEALLVKEATERSIPILSELELGYIFCKVPIIAITGTNGKSTTASLVGHILESAGRGVSVCGNIGIPFTRDAASYKEDTVVVLEVSSFQLEHTRNFRPRISVILNIKEDHLDRHGSLSKYADKKKRIFENQGEGDIAILNYDDPATRRLAGECACDALFFSRSAKVRGAYLEGRNISYGVNGAAEKVAHIRNIRLAGGHNMENILAAVAAARIFGIEAGAIRKALSTFSGLPHRYEYVDTINGIEFIDDSKGTNTDATARALAACRKPVVLIAGGRDKGGDYRAANDIIREKVKHIVLIGEAKEKLGASIDPAIPRSNADSLKRAVGLAFEYAEKGEVVLLSPMCSSFDMFRDYRDRGEQFKALVRGLKDGRRR